MITDLQIGGYFMKKSLGVLLFTAMLCMTLLCTSASANSWGLTGKLYQAVEQSKAWEDYSTLSNQDGPFAVMIIASLIQTADDMHIWISIAEAFIRNIFH